jgi:hypothetical protein
MNLSKLEGKHHAEMALYRLTFKAIIQKRGTHTLNSEFILFGTHSVVPVYPSYANKDKLLF